LTPSPAFLIIRGEELWSMLQKGKLLNKGLIQVYTGDGKGKTTAAIGQALRILACGGKVCIVQFFKPGESSEIGSLKHHFPNVVNIYKVGGSHPYFCREKTTKQIERTKIRCRQDWGKVKKTIQKEWYDLIVLDEVNIALKDEFIPLEEIFQFLKEKPSQQELILTGQGAPPKLIKEADLVTQMKKIKHPFGQGTKARKGIEY